jgi:choline transport protein
MALAIVREPSLEAPDSCVDSFTVAEEVQNSSKNVPWAMTANLFINGATAFGAILTVLFCLGDIDTVLATPTGFPFMAIFLQATNSVAAATAMSCVIYITQMGCLVGGMATASRLLWSFARDGGVPFSNQISYVRIPLAKQSPTYDN